MYVRWCMCVVAIFTESEMGHPENCVAVLRGGSFAHGSARTNRKLWCAHTLLPLAHTPTGRRCPSVTPNTKDAGACQCVSSSPPMSLFKPSLLSSLCQARVGFAPEVLSEVLSVLAIRPPTVRPWTRAISPSDSTLHLLRIHCTAPAPTPPSIMFGGGRSSLVDTVRHAQSPLAFSANRLTPVASWHTRAKPTSDRRPP